MGVPINAAIPLSARPIAPESPMQAAGQVLSIRDAMQRGQIQAQQLQQFQMENQQRAQDLADQQRFANAWKQANGDLDQTLDLATKAGVQPKNIMAFHSMVVDRKTKMATLGEKERDNRTKQLQQLGGQAQALIDMEDENTRAAAWSASRQYAIRNGLATDSDLPMAYPGIDWLRHQASSGLTELQILQGGREIAQKQLAEAELKKAQAELPATQTKAVDEEVSSFSKTAPDNQDDWTKRWNMLSDSAKARVPAVYSPEAVATLQRGQVPVSNRPKYDIELMQAAAMAKMNPQTIRSQVDSVIDPVKYPQQNQRAKAAAANALTNGLGMAGVQAAIKDSADSVQMIERETNPAVIQAGISRAVQTQKALNASSNAALANVPPHLAAPATAAYTKVSNEYADAVGAANEMNDIINLARSGNKVAYAYAPVTGVLTINVGNLVKRVNMPEIRSYAGSGSALDRLEGYFGKQMSGQSIPPQILDAMQELHGTLGNVAKQRYNDKVNVVNQSYGSTFKPAAIEPQSALQAPAGAPPRPAAIPASAAAQYNPDTKQWRYSTDGKKTWQTLSQ